MSSVKYSRLPTSDSVTIDFNSAFSYGSSSTSMNSYKSPFTYGNWDTAMSGRDARYQVEKQSFLNRICHWIVVGLSFLFVLLTFPVSLWFCIKKIKNDQKLAIFRLGRLVNISGPGYVFVMPCIDAIRKVDVKIKAFNVPPQQLITCDRGIIEVGADIHYKIIDVQKSITCIQDLDHALRMLLLASLKNHLVPLDLQDIESSKTAISFKIQDDCNNTTKSWGVEISRVQLSQIKVLSAPQGAPGLNLSSALPQTLQQLTSALMQAASGSMAPQAQGAEGVNLSSLIAVNPSDGGGAAGSYDVVEEEDSILTPREVMLIAKSVINESMVRSVGSTFLFHVEGKNGGYFYLDLKNGNGSAGEGVPPGGDPDVTLSLSSNDMQLMFSNELKPMQAYMSGRLKVSGDLSAALQLDDLVDKIVQRIKTNKVY